MVIIKIKSKITRSYSLLGKYYVKADIKTDSGFDDVRTFYFPDRPTAKTFVKKHTPKRRTK